MRGMAEFSQRKIGWRAVLRIGKRMGSASRRIFGGHALRLTQAWKGRKTIVLPSSSRLNPQPNPRKIGWLAAAAAVFASQAMAADVAVPMTPEDVANWQNASTAFGRCISDLQLKSDLAICRGLSQWLEIQAGKVQIASQRPVDAPAPIPAPTAQPAPPSAPAPAPVVSTPHPSEPQPAAPAARGPIPSW